MIAYDRPISNADVDYFVSFDNRQVGELQGQALVDKLTADKAKGSIVMINGAPTDPNAGEFKAGAHSVLDDERLQDRQGVRHAGLEPRQGPDGDGPGDHARSADDGFVGVYAANDGTAGGAIAAMRSAGIDPASRPTTGQDAELAGIQRIVAGEQYMTVYKAVKQEARVAAQLAVAVLNGEADSDLVNEQIDNGQKDVPSVILTPVEVTQDNIDDTVVRGRLLDGRADLHPGLRGGVREARADAGQLGSEPGMTASATATAAPLLELRGVSKRFGAVQALSGVDFDVGAGEVVGLVGDNGAGKSTLVKVMSGIYLADEGEYRFEERQRTVDSPVDATALGVATVYQDLALCDNLDVVANLFIGREEIANGPAGALRSLDEASMEQQAAELLQTLTVRAPERALGGRPAVRRPAPVGRDRALADRRGEGRAAGRADRRARRRADRAGARADQAPARAGPRRRRHLPQPRRRLRGRRPHLRAAPRAQGRRLRGAGRPRASRSSAASPAPSSASARARAEAGSGGAMSTAAQPAPTPVPAAPGERPPRFAMLQRVAQGELGSMRVLLGLVVIWTIFTVANDRFLTSTNLVNLSLQIAATGMISVGVVLVLLLGEIDLSVGIVSGLCAARDGGAGASSRAGRRCSRSPPRSRSARRSGCSRGSIVTRFGIPSFVVTLAGLIGWQGALLWVLGDTGTVNITTAGDRRPRRHVLRRRHRLDPRGARRRARSRPPRSPPAVAGCAPGSRPRRPPVVAVRVAAVAVVTFGVVAVLTADRGVPLALVILVGFVVIFDYIVRRTTFGRHILAVGGNAEAARRAGIHVNRIRVSVFVLASSMAACGGILFASRLLAVNQSSGGSDLLLLAIAGPVIAGTSLFGGRGTVWSALLGGLVIGSISNGMDLLALPSSTKYMVTGGVLLAAVVIDAAARQRRQQRAGGLRS